MNKIKFKNVFSKAFVVGLAAVAMSSMNVDAATVREKAGAADGIVNGSYVIGISRFTNDVNITADRVLTASQNDMFFKGLSDYKKPSIFQYRGGNWIKYDADNKSSLLNADEVTALGLNAQDIYYVNNEEKILEVAYNSNATNLKFTTDAVGKAITYSNGIMYVPATTKTIQVMNGNTLLETLKKSNTNENGDFNFVSGESNSNGSISADNIITKSEDVSINGNSITVNGTIAWRKADASHGVGLDGIVDSKSGHRIGIEITAPNGTTLNDTSKMEVYVNGRAASTNWTLANTGKNNSFWFTPIVESGKTYTVKVVWDNSNTDIPEQTFTINVRGTLATMPNGTLSGETIYAKDKDGNSTSTVNLSASSTGTTLLTFSGKEIAWDGAVKVFVKADDYYANDNSFDGPVSVTAKYPKTKINDLGYEVDDSTSIPLEADVDYKYDKNTKTLTIAGLNFIDTEVGHKIAITVVWTADGSGNPEHSQDFDVVLSESTPFAYPSIRLEGIRTVVGFGDAAPIYAYHKVKDDVVTISNTQILWSDGNLVNATIVPSTDTNNFDSETDEVKEEYKDLTVYTPDELEHLNVKIDGVLQVKKDSDGKDLIVDGKTVPVTLADGGSESLSINVLIPNPSKSQILVNGEHTVEILWDAKTTVKTFKIKLDGVTLKEATSGTYSVDGQVFNATYTNDIIYVYRPTSHNLTEKNPNDPEHDIIVGQENDFIPFLYEVNGNAVLMNFNNTTSPAKVLVNGKAVTSLTKYLGTKTSAGSRTDECTKLVTGYPVVVEEGKVTTVQVYWDEVNVQEFKVAPHSTYAEFETAKSGVVYVGDKDATKKYSTSITHSGVATWTNVGSQVISIKDESAANKAGYVLDDLITIEAPEALGTIDPEKVQVTISGGKYSANKDDKNFASISLEDSLTVSDSTLVLDPVVTSANQEFTIKVNWNGTFVETYRVTLSNTTLATGEGSIVSPADISAYNGIISYNPDKEGYALEVELSDAPTSVKVVDAEPNKDNSGNVIDGPRTATVTNKKFDVFFTNEIREATITVVWDNGYEKTYTINAKSATIPTLIMANGLTKAETSEGVDYVVKAKVGDNLGKIVDQKLPNTFDFDAEPDAVDDTVELRNGSYYAKTVGTNTYTFTLSKTIGEGDNATTYTSKPVKVKFVVTSDTVTAKSSAAFDGDQLKVLTDVAGGTGNNYAISVAVSEFNGKLYVPVDGSDLRVTTSKNAKGQYETTIVSVRENQALSKKVKVEIITADGTLSSVTTQDDIDALQDHEKNLVVKEVIELPTNIRYTVTLDSNGGVPIDSIIVEPGESVTSLKDAIKPEGKTPNGKYTIKYEFEGWYHSEDFDSEGNKKADAEKVTELTGVEADVNLKANYTVTYWDGNVQVTVDENGNIAE